VINAHINSVVKNSNLKTAWFRMLKFIQVKRSINAPFAQRDSLLMVTRRYMRNGICPWKSSNAWNVECSSLEIVNLLPIQVIVMAELFRSKVNKILEISNNEMKLFYNINNNVSNYNQIG